MGQGRGEAPAEEVGLEGGGVMKRAGGSRARFYRLAVRGEAQGVGVAGWGQRLRERGLPFASGPGGAARPPLRTASLMAGGLPSPQEGFHRLRAAPSAHPLLEEPLKEPITRSQRPPSPPHPAASLPPAPLLPAPLRALMTSSPGARACALGAARGDVIPPPLPFIPFTSGHPTCALPPPPLYSPAACARARWRRRPPLRGGARRGGRGGW